MVLFQFSVAHLRVEQQSGALWLLFYTHFFFFLSILSMGVSTHVFIVWRLWELNNSFKVKVIYQLPDYIGRKPGWLPRTPKTMFLPDCLSTTQAKESLCFQGFCRAHLWRKIIAERDSSKYSLPKQCGRTDSINWSVSVTFLPAAFAAPHGLDICSALYVVPSSKWALTSESVSNA